MIPNPLLHFAEMEKGVYWFKKEKKKKDKVQQPSYVTYYWNVCSYEGNLLIRRKKHVSTYNDAITKDSDLIKK